MKPPICVICGKRFVPSEGGDIVYFKKTDNDIKWIEEIEETGKVEHPPYAEWFCLEHLSLARKYEHLPIREALKKIKEELGI